MKLLTNFLIIFTLILFVDGCKTSYIEVSNNVPDAKYDSEFPSQSVSKELKEISKFVKKLDIIAFYKTYYFPDGSNIKSGDICDSVLDLYSKTKSIDHEAVSGTASVIYNRNKLVCLLTCAHVIDFKDTIFSFYNERRDIIHTVSIKIKQQNHISGVPSGEPIEVVAIDNKKDIALLLKRTDVDDITLSTFNFPIGKTRDLQWGSIVYIMGYPLGNLMVTRAIVSLSEKMKAGMFITDALYNHGISGSPVFAIRDGVPNFELVGMASSAAAQTINTLFPEEERVKENNFKSEYNGKIFVDKSKLINYGVTYSVTIDEIITFIHSNEKALAAKGININDFFL